LEQQHQLIGADPRVVEEYERWLKIIGEDPYSDCHVGVFDVLKAHFLLVDYFFKEGEGLGGVGPKDLNGLHSAVGRQSAGYGTYTKWTDPIDVCATLFFGIAKAHAFHDCNKRTALLTLLFFLHKIGRKPSAPQKAFEDLAVNVADNKLTTAYKEYDRREFQKSHDREVLIISRFIRRNTTKIDHQQQTITYHQLKAILSKFGYYFGKQNGAAIDILKDEVITKTKYLFFTEKHTVARRVTTINYPGDKNQVPLGIIKKLRDELGLTPRNGYDSEVFFGEATPMNALINEYHGAFQRLAFR
jgi:death-on-curing family protein